MCLIVVVFGDEEDSCPSSHCKRLGKERVWMCGRLIVVKELSLNSTLKYQILNKQVLKTLLPLFFPAAKIVGWIDEERSPQYTLEQILEFFQDNQTMMVVPEHPGGPRFLRDEVLSGGRKRGFWDGTTTAGVLSNFTEKGWAGLPVFDTGLRFQRNVPLTQKFSCDWFEQIESGLSTQDQLYLTPMLHMNGIDTFPSLKVIPVDLNRSKPLYYHLTRPKKTPIERCPYLPTHVLLGPMKSGTSTVFEMLKQCTPLCYGRKEPHVFDNFNLKAPSEQTVCNYYYRLIHPERPNDCLAIDITPSNAMLSSSAKFFNITKPKMVGLFRDPIDRLVSQLNMGCCVGAPIEEQLVVVSDELATLEKMVNPALGGQRIPDWFGKGPNHRNNWGYLTKSMYDITLAWFPQLREQKWEFETLVHNCSQLARDLAKFVDRPELLECLLSQCENSVHVRPFCKRKHMGDCASREVVPQNVVKFLKENNQYWYKDRFLG